MGGGGLTAGREDEAGGGLAPERPLRQLGLTPAELGLVRGVPLFAGVGEGQLALLLAGAVVRRYERGAVLFLQGEPADRFFVVLDGWVRLSRETPDGQHSTIAVFGPGESLAEAAIFDGGLYPVTGGVVAPSRLLVVPARDFVGQLRRSPELALNLLAAMSRHLRRLVRQVEHLTSRSSLQRVADFLLRLCPEGERRAEVELPLEKVLIAARLGMQPETLSRSLAQLRKAGVETSGHRVAIGDVDRLRRLAARGRAEPAARARPTVPPPPGAREKDTA
jgi:CRP/FNR family transcriptional regulator, dissimilatory nitrate respiration regulator